MERKRKEVELAWNMGALDEIKEALVTMVRGIETNIRFMRFHAIQGDLEGVENHAGQARKGIDAVDKVLSKYYHYASRMVDLRARQISEGEGVRGNESRHG